MSSTDEVLKANEKYVRNFDLGELKAPPARRLTVHEIAFWTWQFVGALVLNGIAVSVKAAEMALALKGLTGAFVSRRGTYAKASAACIDEYLRARW